jgi:hypothetical protein
MSAMNAQQAEELLAALEEISQDQWKGNGGRSGMSSRGRAKLALARVGAGYEHLRPCLEAEYAMDRGGLLTWPTRRFRASKP